MNGTCRFKMCEVSQDFLRLLQVTESNWHVNGNIMDMLMTIFK